MARFEKTRCMYLRTENNNPHTCILIRVDADSNTIHYALSKRVSHNALITLRQKMQRIQELGGVVPAQMRQKFSSLPRDFSKRRARFVATRTLEHNPRLIEGVDVSLLNCHEITRLVMQSLVDRQNRLVQVISGGMSMPTAMCADPENVVESAHDWLHMNVHDRATAAAPLKAAENVQDYFRRFMNGVVSFNQDEEVQA